MVNKMKMKILPNFGWLLSTGLVFLWLFGITWLRTTKRSQRESIQSSKAAQKPWLSFKFQPAGSDFAGFPACSFTHLFGFKMKSFGHTAAAGSIDNNTGGQCLSGG